MALNVYHKCERCGNVVSEHLMEHVPHPLTNVLMWVCYLSPCVGCAGIPYYVNGYVWQCVDRRGKGAVPCEHVARGVCVG